MPVWVLLAAAPTAVLAAPAVPPHAPIEGGRSAVQAHVLRLRPGQDLKGALMNFARSHDLRAGFVMTTVGSLRTATLRLADQPGATELKGPFEIVSLVGTLSRDGAHLHLSVSDAQGRTTGGHLMDGCPVYTTAEIVIGELGALRFTRVVDPTTGFRELGVEPRTGIQ